jgi:hypothetical protein
MDLLVVLVHGIHLLQPSMNRTTLGREMMKKRARKKEK